MAELIIQNPSITSGDFSFSGDAITAIAGHPVAGAGGGGIQSDYVYVPSFNDQTGDITFTLGVTGSEGKGPWHISGAQGPAGENGKSLSAEYEEDSVNRQTQVKIGQIDGSVQTTFNLPWGVNGTNGANGTSLSAKTSTITGGHRVEIWEKGASQYDDSFNVMDGENGVSPTVTVTNIPADPDDPNHKNGGTEITITDATTTNKFSAWNGNDGTMAGAPDIEGKNGISATLESSTYKVGLSAAFYTAVTSVSSKLNTSTFDTYTATTAPGAFQPIGDYATTSDISDMATKTWVGQQGYLTEVPAVIHDTTLTGQGNDNNSKLGVAWSALSGNTIASALSACSATVAANLGTSSFADITGAINAKADKPADMTSNTPYCFSGGQWADMTQTYFSKTEATGTFLQKNLTNTLSGDGTSSNKLGVNWSNLSGNTITSALSAGSASYAVALGTTASYSALSDITVAINDAKFAGVSIAAGSSITGNGLSTNKLGLVTSAENALTAVDNKLDKTAIVTATIDNTNYVTAVNINSTNIPIKGTSFWEVTAATGTTASNDTWQHYISTTNTFNYYKMVIHPYGTSSAQEWANDGIIHIILEA